MTTEEEEKDFMSKVIPEVHELFDKEDIFSTAGGRPNKEVLRIFLKASQLIETRRRELRKGYSEDFYINTARVFYDALYGYFIAETDISHYSKGGWVLSCLSAFSIICELSSSLQMFLDDNDVPFIDQDNKYINMLLRNKILKSDGKGSKITGLIK